jgi:hypothetical protein
VLAVYRVLHPAGAGGDDAATGSPAVKRWEAWWNHSALIAISVTGVVYGVFKYFVPSPDPNSRAGHPFQPWAMKAHLLIAPFAICGIGLILRRTRSRGCGPARSTAGGRARSCW